MIHQASAKLRRPIQPKAVALVGFGPSMKLMHDLPPDVEIWSLNAVEEYDFPRLDRAFELHPLRDLVLETPRWDRLRKPLPYPVYVLEADPRIPSGVAYPIEAVCDEAFENIIVGDENARYMDSTFPYMLALAVHEGYKVVIVCGFEFQSDTEYRYQRPGAALMIGWAAGKGVKVILPEETGLLPRTLYGYEDYQMISRPGTVLDGSANSRERLAREAERRPRTRARAVRQWTLWRGDDRGAGGPQRSFQADVHAGRGDLRHPTPDRHLRPQGSGTNGNV